jgi:muramidase (phage lysozyme)
VASSEINLKAFLKLIRFAEHKRDDDGVYYIVYGGSTFTDTSKHPNKAMTAWGRTRLLQAPIKYSTAHGKKPLTRD